jgi:uncharacterized protein YkwD
MVTRRGVHPHAAETTEGSPMTKPLRALPLTLLCTLACDVDDETATRIGDGVVGVAVDESDVPDADFDFTNTNDPAFACSDAGWNTAWATLEAAVVTKVNQKRAAGAVCGGVTKPPVPALTVNAKLRCAARNHSKDMANKNFMSHTGSNGSTFAQRITAAGYAWLAAAENVAAGYATASAVMTGWMASSGHCKNIMSSSYKHIGVGYAFNSTADFDHYWTIDFARN